MCVIRANERWVRHLPVRLSDRAAPLMRHTACRGVIGPGAEQIAQGMNQGRDCQEDLDKARLIARRDAARILFPREET